MTVRVAGGAASDQSFLVTTLSVRQHVFSTSARIQYGVILTTSLIKNNQLFINKNIKYLVVIFKHSARIQYVSTVSVLGRTDRMS
jgi:hypothetical protein